jgi:hypothetical protein
LKPAFLKLARGMGKTTSEDAKKTKRPTAA